MRSLRAGVALILVCLVLVSCASQPVIEKPANSELMSEADQRWSQLVARYPHAARPEVTRVHTVSPKEWAAVQQGCLRTSGFAVAIGADGAIESQIPVEQGESYALAEYVCALKYPLSPKYTQPLDHQMLIRLYEYQTGDLVECLERFGYFVDAPPSEDIYIQNYYTKENWSPYAKLGPVDSAVSVACPEVPEDLWEWRS